MRLFGAAQLILLPNGHTMLILGDGGADDFYGEQAGSPQKRNYQVTQSAPS